MNVVAVRQEESLRSRTVDAMRPDREPTNGSCSTWVTSAATDMGAGRSTPNRSASDGRPLRRLLVSPQIRLALSERVSRGPGTMCTTGDQVSLSHSIDCDWWAGRRKCLRVVRPSSNIKV